MPLVAFFSCDPSLKPTMNIIKKTAAPIAALTFSLLFTNLASASTVNIPDDKPTISVFVPDSWEPEETDKGIACESPDKVATLFIEVTSTKGVDALIDENIDWLTKDQGVRLDKASEQKQSFEAANLEWQQQRVGTSYCRLCVHRRRQRQNSNGDLLDHKKGPGTTFPCHRKDL
jgi:hypothetical protein